MRNPGIQEDLQAETTGNWTLSWIHGFLRGLRLQVVTGNSIEMALAKAVESKDG
jgi:hypothetical protein